ncbi:MULTISPECIES: hypothetical protein [Oxalobacteraceae]|jgi:hypothetical protein|uniref:hypothetical protein n=1 Tax=Oxalobacteraceae TaxID=75682 RepID=UPI0010A57FF6|nr:MULTISPECIES: hypothetical protein [Oxalobacteraceae]
MQNDTIIDTELVEQITQPPERFLAVLQDFCRLVRLNFDEVLAAGEVVLGDVRIGFMHFGALNPTCMRLIVEINLPSSERNEKVFLQLLQANAVLPVEGLAFASFPESDRLAFVQTLPLDEQRGLNGQQLHEKILALVEMSRTGHEIVEKSFGQAVFSGFNKV